MFLERAATLEPELLKTLRRVKANDANGLLAWAKRWNLTDPWCRALVRDTARWDATDRDARGWEFEVQGIFVGSFPFKTEPLLLPGPFYLDLTYLKRSDFKGLVLKKVAHAVDEYCDRTEAAARAAGLKRAPRKRGLEHFDWLARYQVKGESFVSIARNPGYKFKGGRQTVHKAITQLAKYLELTLRSSTNKTSRRS